MPNPTYTPAQLADEVQTLAENYRSTFVDFSNISDAVDYCNAGAEAYHSKVEGLDAEIEEDNGIFEDISEAIQSKTGQAEPYDKSEMASTISSELVVPNLTTITIQPTTQQQTATPTAPNIGFSSVTVEGYVPPAPVEEKSVFFYDYDGTVLYSYTATEALALNSLPALPTHSGLVAQKWNMTLTTVKAYAQADKNVDIGCLYDTDDGSTKMYLKVVAGVALPSTALRLRLSPQSSLTIEWGDGTSSVVSNSASSWQNTTTNHTYTEFETETDIEICIRISGNEFELNFTGQYSIFNNATLPLIRLNIGSNCSAINSYAFYQCYSLTSVTIPDSVTSIGSNAFNVCYSLTSIIIPDSVMIMVLNTFNACYSLTSIIIPDSITSIGENAFSSCYSLTSITIPDSVTSIGRYAFSDCYSLISITIPDSVMSIGERAFNGCYSLTSVTIPNGVTSIDSYTFSNCFALTSITIPDSVISIGDYAFNFCESLTSITIPDSVISIGSCSFIYCYSLKSITIPDSVTSIGSSAFYQCYSLKSITIPDSVTSIGSSAFGSCYRLTSITIPDSVTSIGSNTFNACYSLTSIIIPDSITSIGSRAFNACKNLLSCILSNSITSIESRVFYNSTNLQKVDLSEFTDPTAIPTLANTDAFTNVPGKFIVANAEMLAAFRAKTNWSSFASTKWEVKT